MITKPLLLLSPLFLVSGVLGQQPEYAQCGGIGYTGATTCASPYVCTYENDYYYQCLPSTGSTTKTTTAATTTKASTTTTKVVTTTSVAASSTCTVASGGSSSVDDTPAIAAAFKSCGSGGKIVLASGTTYHMNTFLTVSGCTGCTWEIDGTLQLSGSTSYWTNLNAAIVLTSVKGMTISGSGTIDGQGQAAWDLLASGSSSSRVKTILGFSSCSNIAVSGITIKNPPNTFISVSGSTSMTFTGMTLTAVSTSSNEPKNTDGWDIGSGSSYVTLRNIKVTNDDDCVAFKAGSSYVEIYDISCDGSHGLSVGSLGSGAGSNDLVEHIYVSGATMTNCKDGGKAVGIKLYPSAPTHGTATVNNVTWSGVSVSNCQYGAQIQSCYGDSADCAAYPSTATLTNINFDSFTGTVSTNLLADLNCPGKGTCDLYFSGFNLKAASGTAQILCSNIDDTSSLGITCNGAASG